MCERTMLYELARQTRLVLIANRYVYTCLTGSGTLLTEQATASLTAVSSDILCPIDTYTGLAASSDVRTAWWSQRRVYMYMEEHEVSTIARGI